MPNLPLVLPLGLKVKKHLERRKMSARHQILVTGAPGKSTVLLLCIPRVAISRCPASASFVILLCALFFAASACSFSHLCRGGVLRMSHVAAEVHKSRSVPSRMLQLRCTNREVYQASRMKGMLRLAWPLQDDTTNRGSR